MTSDHALVLAAVSSAVAALLSVVATLRVPGLAERLRREGERHNERRKQKLYIFATLMQERAYIASENAVRAFNLIDVVFNENRNVREAWSELLLGLSIKPYVQYVVEERIRKLLAAIAADIGIADELRNDDLGRVYRPEALAQDQFLKDFQRRQAMAAFATIQERAVGNEPNPLWPPRP